MDTAVIYARKSQEDKSRQIQSIPDQLIEISRLEDRFELKAIQTFSESKTGKVSGVRTEFYEMIKMIEQGKANTIFCVNANRLARNGVDGGKIIELVDKGLIHRIITPSSVFDKDNSYMLWIEFMGATKYSKDLSKIVTDRIKLKAERGDASGLAPLGYRNTPELLKGQRVILPDEERWDLCRKWWEYMLTGLYTVEQSLEQITKDGLRNRKGKIISRSKSYDFFRDIFYTGSFVQSGITYPNGNHKAMVTMAEWMKVQQTLDSKGKKGANSLDMPDEKTFQGMLNCAECGATVTMERHLKKYKNGTSQTFWYYRCTKKLGSCSQPCLNAKEFNPQIEAYIKGLELNPDFGQWVKKVLKRRNKQEFNLEKKTQELNTKRLADITDRKGKLYDMKIDGLFSDMEYQKKKNDLLIEEKLIRESYLKPNTKYWESVIDNTINFATSVQNLFQYGDIYTRQMVLRILGSNLMLKDKKVEIESKRAFIFLKDVQNDVWSKNLILEPKIMPKLPHDVTNYRTSIHSCARDWT